MYSKNFTAANEKLCLTLHYNGDNSYENSEIVPYPLCLKGLPKHFSQSNTKVK